MTHLQLSWRSLAAGMLACHVFLGCNASPPPRVAHPVVDRRLSQAAPELDARQREPASESVTLVLDVSISAAPEEPGADLELVAGLADADQTLVAVDEDSWGDSSRALRFVPEKRGNDIIGVRVFFTAREAGGGDAAYLGLRLADRIEEVDGLPVAGMDALLQAWQDVGKRPEVRFLISRGGQPHTIIYRRRSFAMP